MGRVAMLATDVDDDLPMTVPAFSGLIEHVPALVFLADGNTESTMRILPIAALADVPFVSHSILDPNRCCSGIHEG